MLNPFEADVKESFKAFYAKNDPANAVTDEGPNLLGGKVDVKAVETGLKDFLWTTKEKDFKRVFKTYDVLNENYSDKNFLNL